VPRPLPSLILFARVPRPGLVKTRLARVLTADGSARLYRAFLEDAARVYLAADRWVSVLAAEPDPEDPLLATLFGSPWRRVAQPEGDLGARLRVLFEAEFARGAPAAAAVGSDHPALRRRLLEEAFGRVGDGVDAALVPAEDGGYCAVALSRRASLSTFSGIPWSSDSVLATTLERLRAAGMSFALLETAYDVDRPEDLERLRIDLAARDAGAADFPRATARALADLLAERGR
jgi:hypothetical protein